MRPAGKCDGNDAEHDFARIWIRSGYARLVGMPGDGCQSRGSSVSGKDDALLTSVWTPYRTGGSDSLSFLRPFSHDTWLRTNRSPNRASSAARERPASCSASRGPVAVPQIKASYLSGDSALASLLAAFLARYRAAYESLTELDTCGGAGTAGIAFRFSKPSAAASRSPQARSC